MSSACDHGKPNKLCYECELEQEITRLRAEVEEKNEELETGAKFIDQAVRQVEASDNLYRKISAECNQLRTEVENLNKLNNELTDELEKAVFLLPRSGVPVGFDLRCDKLISRARGEVDDE